MARIRHNIIETPTLVVGDICVVFEQDGLPKNVLINNADLAAQLAELPALIPNPARAPVEEACYLAAEQKLLADGQ